MYCRNTVKTPCFRTFPNGCCASDQTCFQISSANIVNHVYEAALCCPTGSDCGEVQPIPCQPDLLNSTQGDSEIMATFVGGLPNLTTCNSPTVALDSCCPPGYKCNQGLCVIVGHLLEAGSTNATNSTPTTTPVASSVSMTLSASETSPTGSLSSPPGGPDATSRSDTKGIALSSAIGGLLLLLLVALGYVLMRRRIRNRRQAKRKPTTEEYWAKAELENTNQRRMKPLFPELEGRRSAAELDGEERSAELGITTPRVHQEASR